MISILLAILLSLPLIAGASDSADHLHQKPPFPEVSRRQAAELSQVVRSWHARQAEIRTFDCRLTQWEYDLGFGPARFHDSPCGVREGRLAFTNSGKWYYQVAEIRRLNSQTGQLDVAADCVRERWACDGQSLWEYNERLKLVIQHEIPRSLRGPAFHPGDVDSLEGRLMDYMLFPLPLLCTDPEILQRRFFLKIITPQNHADREIWFDIYPRTSRDASIFRRAVLALHRDTLDLCALRVYFPGASYYAWQFSNVRINDPHVASGGLFPPSVPVGWEKRMESLPEATCGGGEPSTTSIGSLEHRRRLHRLLKVFSHRCGLLRQ